MAQGRELRALNAQIELTALNVRNVALNVRNIALNAKLKMWLERRTKNDDSERCN